VDLDFDSSNCGGCGVACPAGTACQGGYCFTSTVCAAGANGEPCPLGPGAVAEGTCCGGSCVDTERDPQNCAWCGGTCAPGESCGGAGEGCVAPDGGRAGPGVTSACTQGTEGDFCWDQDAGADGVCCAGRCVSQNDPAACSACGVGCPACDAGCLGGTACVTSWDRCYPITCGAGSDGDACAFGPGVGEPAGSFGVDQDQPLSFHPGTCCAGACVSIAQDPANCGFCGAACGSGICATGSSAISVCVPPAPDADCPQSCAPGAVCVNGVCASASCALPAPFTDQLCAAADGAVGLCCYGPCVDISNDPQNCGGCGVNGFRCPSGQSCVHGVCSGTPAGCGLGQVGAFCNLDAGTGFLCCPGVGCIDTSADPMNCGRCGNVCSGGTSCVAGQCR